MLNCFQVLLGSMVSICTANAALGLWGTRGPVPVIRRSLHGGLVSESVPPACEDVQAVLGLLRPCSGKERDRATS